MKIAVCSDLHLEFGPLVLTNDEGADVLVLSGDICVARDLKQHDVYGIMENTRSSRLHDFFQNCSEQFPHVIYIAGNHEHYDGDFATTYTKLKMNLARLSNVYVLDREVVTIGDVTFVGGTMWTNMNNRDPLTMFHIKSMMNDFRGIENSNEQVYRTVPLYKKNEDGTYARDEKGFYIQEGTKKKAEAAKFSPENAVEEFEKFTGYLANVTAEKHDQKFVVCTHHTPSYKSVAPYYMSDTLMNGGYHSHLDDFIMDRPQIKLWTHGHTHEDFDYKIGETRVVCNPRGYIKYEARASKFALKYVEV